MHTGVRPEPIAINDVGQSFGGQDVRSIRHLEMQVRFARVARVSDAAQHLAASHAISFFHADASGLQVGVIGELPTAHCPLLRSRTTWLPPTLPVVTGMAGLKPPAVRGTLSGRPSIVFTTVALATASTFCP